MTGPSGPPRDDIVDRYETLRMGALGEALPPEARHGLTLLLRRGLWAWACAAVEHPTTRTPSPPADPLPPHRRHDLARLLAGMALATTPARSPA